MCNVQTVNKWVIFPALFISYMVDASDIDKIEASRNELHNLLAKPQLEGIPVLVLGNKRDLPNALDEKEIIERMWVLLCSQFRWTYYCRLLLWEQVELSLHCILCLLCITRLDFVLQFMQVCRNLGISLFFSRNKTVFTVILYVDICCLEKVQVHTFYLL